MRLAPSVWSRRTIRSATASWEEAREGRGCLVVHHNTIDHVEALRSARPATCHTLSRQAMAGETIERLLINQAHACTDTQTAQRVPHQDPVLPSHKTPQPRPWHPPTRLQALFALRSCLWALDLIVPRASLAPSYFFSVTVSVSRSPFAPLAPVSHRALVAGLLASTINQPSKSSLVFVFRTDSSYCVPLRH